MRQPSALIRDVLVSAKLAEISQSSVWPCFVAHEPSAPDNCVTVYDTGGGRRDTDELDILSPEMQVRIRSKSYSAAYEKAKAIADFLSTFSDDVFVCVRIENGVVGIGLDENDRHLLTINLSTICNTQG